MLRGSGQGRRVSSLELLIGWSLIAIAPSACGALERTVPFGALDHLATTQPPSLAEGGHSSAVALPPGVGFDASLTGVVQDDAPAYSPRFEFEISAQDDRAGAHETSVRPLAEGAVLVDDDGERFALSRVLEPLPTGDEVPTSTKRYRLDFRLPPTYRFERISRVTIHWLLTVEGHGAVPVSSRFRR